MFKVKLADICIGIENDILKDFFKDYLVNEEPLFTVNATESDIIYEQSKVEFKTNDLECLKLAVYRKICENLPLYDAFLIHGSALSINDNGLLLAGRSGAGKSTHARLLRESYEVTMINDDKPLVRIVNNVPYVYGTPYNGKHHLSSNISRPLKNIIFINQDTNNSINLIDKNDSYTNLYVQTYRPANKESLKRTLELINITNNYVDTYLLNCDISNEAANLTYKTINK